VIEFRYIYLVSILQILIPIYIKVLADDTRILDNLDILFYFIFIRRWVALSEGEIDRYQLMSIAGMTILLPITK
jgi:hypothetical protein